MPVLEKLDNVHSNFFTYFNKDKFFENVEIEEYGQIGGAFKQNLVSVVSILSVPVTLSASRTKHHIFDKILGGELILNAPFPQDLYETEEEFQKAKDEGAKVALITAKQKFYQELDSKEGSVKFWNTTFGFLDDCLSYNSDLKYAAVEILKQGTVLLWSAFEVLARDCATLYLNMTPEKLKDFGQKAISIETLEAYRFDITNHIGDILSEQHDWSNLGTIKKVYKTLFPQNDVLHELLKDKALWKINQRRHLIVHRRGVVDKKYSESTDDIFEVGEELIIKPNDLKIGLETIKNIGLELLKTIKK